MLTQNQITDYQRQCIERAGYCIQCGGGLKENEVYACEKCTDELLGGDVMDIVREENNG